MREIAGRNEKGLGRTEECLGCDHSGTFVDDGCLFLLELRASDLKLIKYKRRNSGVITTE